jgi:hypothetical protein
MRNKCGISNYRGNWNHLNIAQTITEQHTRKARNKGTAKKKKKKNHIGHCAHTTESANVKVQSYFTGEITLLVVQIVNTEQLQRYIP